MSDDQPGISRPVGAGLIPIQVPDEHGRAWRSSTREGPLRSLGGPFRFASVVTCELDGGRVIVGEWFCEPAEFDVLGHPFDEFCRVVEGFLHVTETDGTERLYEPGDAFAIRRGYRGRWRIQGAFRKEVMVVLPAPDASPR